MSGDAVKNPSHYKAKGIEVIDVIEAFGLQHDAYLFNVITYILRAKFKGAEQQDLEKALNYLHRRVHGRWMHEPEYRPRDDLNKSVAVAYEAIRERVAAGGPGYEPPKAST